MDIFLEKKSHEKYTAIKNNRLNESNNYYRSYYYYHHEEFFDDLLVTRKTFTVVLCSCDVSESFFTSKLF